MSTRSPFGLPRWLMVLAVLAVGAVSGCQTVEDKRVPPELFGRWMTEAPGYEACYMQISETTIDFQTAEKTLRQYTIERVEYTEKEKDKISSDVIDIHYKGNDGDGYLLSIVLVEEDGQNRLQFFHQPHLVWTWDS